MSHKNMQTSQRGGKRSSNGANVVQLERIAHKDFPWIPEDRWAQCAEALRLMGPHTEYLRSGDRAGAVRDAAALDPYEGTSNALRRIDSEIHTAPTGEIAQAYALHWNVAADVAVKMAVPASGVLDMLAELRVLPSADAWFVQDAMPPRIFRQHDQHFIVGVSISVADLERYPAIWWTHPTDLGAAAGRVFDHWMETEQPKFL